MPKQIDIGSLPPRVARRCGNEYSGGEPDALGDAE
jgi:hypothetical protein